MEAGRGQDTDIFKNQLDVVKGLSRVSVLEE